MKLYAWQEREGVQEILKQFKTHRSVCLSWYTGAGKTNVLAELCKRMIKQNPEINIGISAYITTEIRDQIEERLHNFGLKDHTHKATTLKYNQNKQITIFNPQAYCRTLPDVKFDLLVIDESHVGVDSKNCVLLPKIIKKCTHAKTKILLVSATPWDTLALKEFKDAVVLKRPLDQGLKDGLITDFKFHAEQTDIEFDPDDFSKVGDLNKNAIVRKMAVVKSTCIGKMRNILSRFDKDLGSKVLVICPPGNNSEVAREMAKLFNGLAFIQERSEKASGTKKNETSENLNRFRADPNIRFLFVTNKCQVGFDYQSLSSVIDLTMTRNIRNLAQRFGRIARRNGKQEKHYFYVYDKSLVEDKIEWLISTAIDFSLGAYDGWTSKTVKYRPIELRQHTFLHPITISINKIIQALRPDASIYEKKKLAFISGAPPKIRTLDIAKEEMKQYTSRTEMWAQNPSLYKWFRLNAKHVMDEYFPLKRTNGMWNEFTVTAKLKEASKEKMGRRRFQDTYPGAKHWLYLNKRNDLLEKYLPLKITLWSDEKALKALSEVRAWNSVRLMGGLRGWLQKNGGEAYWREIWLTQIPGQKIMPVSGRGSVAAPRMPKKRRNHNQGEVKNPRVGKMLEPIQEIAPEIQLSKMQKALAEWRKDYDERQRQKALKRKGVAS